jgi:prolyl 4-hydroxylase
MDQQVIWIITTLVFFVALDLHHAETLTATDVSRLLSAESELSGVLTEYIEHERQRLARLEEVAWDYQRHSAQGLRQPEKSIDNLVSAFVTMKRFTVDWERVARDYIETNDGTELLVQKIRQTVAQFPGRGELDATARALMRLQDTYDLTPAEMARGNIEGMQAGSSDHLSPDDCFQLGKIAYAAEDYYHAILWIEHALHEVKNGVPAFTDRDDLYDHLNYAYYLENDVRRAANLAKEWLEYNPSAERAKNNLYHYEQVLTETQNGTCQTPESCSSDRTVKRNRNEWQQTQAFHNYEELCRGEEVMEITNKHRLHCSYKRSHPLFIYAPLKQEIVNFEPLLLMYHDLLTDSEIAKAQELAIPKLHRSAIFRTDPGEATKYTEHRTSKTSWIGDHEHPLIDRISEKSAAVSGLTRSTVEQLQVRTMSSS